MYTLFNLKSIKIRISAGTCGVAVGNRKKKIETFKKQIRFRGTVSFFSGGFFFFFSDRVPLSNWRSSASEVCTCSGVSRISRSARAHASMDKGDVSRLNDASPLMVISLKSSNICRWVLFDDFNMLTGG